MVLQSWMSENVQNIRQSHKIWHEAMKNWNVEWTAGGKTLAEVKFYSGIFQGDAT